MIFEKENPTMSQVDLNTMQHSSRRQVIFGGMGLAAMAMLGSTRTLAAPRSTGAKLPRLGERIGIQLYTVSEDFAADRVATLTQLRDIGYREIETGVGGSASELRSLVDRLGMTVPSCHAPLESLYPGMLSLAEPDQVIAWATAAGCRHVVIPIVPFKEAMMKRPDARTLMSSNAGMGEVVMKVIAEMTDQDWISLSRQLNEKGAILAKAGLRLGYHNHNAEFRKLGNGQSALELMMASTDPKLVDFELDLGWAMSAGYDPVAFLGRYGQRISQVHVKDLMATPANTDMKLNSTELGRGIQNWPAIARALKRAGVQHAFVEQEPAPGTKSAGMAAARDCYRFIQPVFAAARA